MMHTLHRDPPHLDFQGLEEQRFRRKPAVLDEEGTQTWPSEEEMPSDFLSTLQLESDSARRRNQIFT